MDASLFPTGVIVGLLVAAPVGPTSVLCIRRALAHGQLAGMATGLGIASADAIFAGVASVGIGIASALILGHRAWLELPGGLLLCYLGLSYMRLPPAGAAVAAGRVSAAKGYLSALVLAPANPSTILSFAALFTGARGLATREDAGSALLLVLGVFAGSVLCWLLLTSVVRLARNMLPQNAVQWINRLSGGLILAFGIAILARLIER